MVIFEEEDGMRPDTLFKADCKSIKCSKKIAFVTSKVYICIERIVL